MSSKSGRSKEVGGRQMIRRKKVKRSKHGGVKYKMNTREETFFTSASPTAFMGPGFTTAGSFFNSSSKTERIERADKVRLAANVFSDDDDDGLEIKRLVKAVRKNKKKRKVKQKRRLQKLVKKEVEKLEQQNKSKFDDMSNAIETLKTLQSQNRAELQKHGNLIAENASNIEKNTSKIAQHAKFIEGLNCQIGLLEELKSRLGELEGKNQEEILALKSEFSTQLMIFERSSANLESATLDNQRLIKETGELFLTTLGDLKLQTAQCQEELQGLQIKGGEGKSQQQEEVEQRISKLEEAQRILEKQQEQSDLIMIQSLDFGEQVNDLKSFQEHLTQEIHQNKQMIFANREQCTSIASLRNVVLQAREDLDDMLLYHEEEHQELRDRFEAMEESYKDTKSRVGLNTTEAGIRDEVIIRLQQNLSALALDATAERDLLRQQIEEVKADGEGKIAYAVRELRSEAGEQTALIKEKQEELAGIQQNQDAEIKLHASKISVAEKDIKDVDGKIEECSKRHNSLEDKVRSVSKKQEEIEEEVEALDDWAKRAEKKQDSLVETQKAFDSLLVRIVEKMESLEEDRMKNEKKMDELKAQIGDMENKDPSTDKNGLLDLRIELLRTINEQAEKIQELERASVKREEYYAMSTHFNEMIGDVEEDVTKQIEKYRKFYSEHEDSVKAFAGDMDEFRELMSEMEKHQMDLHKHQTDLQNSYDDFMPMLDKELDKTESRIKTFFAQAFQKLPRPTKFEKKSKWYTRTTVTVIFGCPCGCGEEFRFKCKYFSKWIKFAYIGSKTGAALAILPCASLVCRDAENDIKKTMKNESIGMFGMEDQHVPKEWMHDERLWQKDEDLLRNQLMKKEGKLYRKNQETGQIEFEKKAKFYDVMEYNADYMVYLSDSPHHHPNELGPPDRSEAAATLPDSQLGMKSKSYANELHAAPKVLKPSLAQPVQYDYQPAVIGEPDVRVAPRQGMDEPILKKKSTIPSAFDSTREFEQFLQLAKITNYKACLEKNEYLELEDLFEAEDPDLLELGMKKTSIKRMRRKQKEWIGSRVGKC